MSVKDRFKKLEKKNIMHLNQGSR